ncbi:MAG: alpha-glucosidase [Deltaproteobacteria bacterium]|nr:alpha-glucosidase [Deltaproteobacteria bacterium]MBW2385284.1 alpha-glucosidase [Deltaproteobacteria bacterium]MBW2695934.1 alpha-glucosidase [Deltaproteobacteria bacterium]
MSSRIVLIGAGSAQFGFDMLGDVFQSVILEGCHIVLHDINGASLERVHKAGEAFVREHGLRVTLSATTSRAEALAGANFCVISIEVGDRFALWEQDRSVPQQYGFRQVFGENGGPGGLFHSLRVVPPILEICEDIQRICPDAWVFNYSNPMSRICTTVHRKFPDLKFVGVCHEIASLYQHLPLILETPISNISFRAGGLNHFSILVEASYRDSGRDAYPDVLAKAAGYFENLPDLGSIMKKLFDKRAGSTPESEPALPEGAHPWAERGVFRVLLERFHCLPITTDSHIGEYMQWAHDVADHRAILDFYIYYKKWIMRSDPAIKKTRSERLVKVIEGLLTGERYEEAALNLPNRGFVPQLPEFIAVEVPAWVDGRGIHGITLPSMPKGFAGLLSNQVAVHDLTADAILHESKQLVLQALLVDPVVDRVDAAEDLIEAMISLQPEYLGYLA